MKYDYFGFDKQETMYDLYSGKFGVNINASSFIETVEDVLTVLRL